MNDFQKGIFSKIQKQANVNPNEILEVADSVKSADFSDESTVRQLVRQLSAMANKPISEEKEDKIVEAICNQKGPSDLQSLTKFFNN